MAHYRHMEFESPDLTYALSSQSPDAELAKAAEWISSEIYQLALRQPDANNYWGKRRWLWGSKRTRRTIGDWREIRHRNRHYAWLQLQAGAAGFELARRQQVRLACWGEPKRVA